MLDLLWAAANEGTGRRAALESRLGKTTTRTTATPCSWALPGTGSSASDRPRRRQVVGQDDGRYGARALWRNFMASALAVDGRSGPAPLRDYRRVPSEARIGEQEPAS
jgi:penicillin-binding protein 1A